MPNPRRRIIRPSAPLPSVSRRAVKLRTRLEREQRLLAGWIGCLTRAFHGFEKYHQRTARLEREIRTLETPHVPHD